MNMKKWLEKVKNEKCKNSMPVLSFPAVSLMGITVKELIGDSKLQAEAMKKVAERAKTLASVSLMDLSVEAEAFGAEIRVCDDEVPTVIGALVTDEESANNLAVPKVGAARTAIYIDAIKIACSEITDRPVFAGVIGPFSLAGRLMDVTEAMINCYAEPDMVHTTLKKATQFLIEYIKAYKEAGANGVVMAEPLAGMLSPALAAEFSEPYVREIAESVQDDEFIVIYHNCGNNTIQMIDSILATNCDAYHFGDAIEMSEMMKHIPADTIAMGNVSPSAQFKGGTPETMKAETKRIMSECCKYDNFVISSGCDIPPSCSWDNIDAFFEAVDEYYNEAGE